MTTCPCFDNLEFHIFDAGGTQSHFITSLVITVRIRTLSVHGLNKDQSKSFTVRPSGVNMSFNVRPWLRIVAFLVQ